MSKIHIGLNAEFSRSSDKPFEWAVKAAVDMGYKFFEPMVHYGRELMSEAGYYHTVSMSDDPYRILDRVAPRLVHLHAKDIGVEQSDAERGKVTGTAVGCACGDGVVDWAKVIDIVSRKAPRDIVFSVECGTPEQADRSLKHLTGLLGKHPDRATV